MGRSKFPGKPSKSIHRKRISVLQLDVEDKTHGTETPTEELQQQQQQQQQQSEQDARTQNKSNNCDDDDDDDDNAPSAGGSGAGGGGGSSSIGAQATAAEGNGNASAGEANGSNVNGSNGGSGRQNKSTNAVENVEQIIITKNRQSIDSNEHNSNSSVSNDAAMEKDDFDDFGDVGGGGEDEDDDDEDENEMAEKTTTISGGRQIGGIAASALRLARKSSNKKFKNLNLARAEVMLPSTSKLKLQQQLQLQLNCPSTSSPMSPTTATENATTTATISSPTTTAIVSEAIATTITTTTTTTGTSCINPFAVTESSKDVVEGALNNVALHTKSNDMASEAGTGSVNLSAELKTPTSPKCSPSISNAAHCSSPTVKAAATSPPPAAATKQKKTVTFKNILETSDDKSAVKRFYNPDNRIPLVSIMKKECMNRSLAYSRNSECIVRPSILSKILNKNSNIDKLNSLKFRTAPNATTTSATATDTGSNVFGSALSRVFGALAEDEDDEQAGVTFRLSKKETNETNNKNDNDDDEEQSSDDDSENGESQSGDNAAFGENTGTCAGQSESDDEANTSNTNQNQIAAADEKRLVLDRHFILPKRSSSRIIKPNKRLMEDLGTICIKKTSKDTNLSSNNKREESNYFGSLLNLGIKSGKGAAGTATTTTSTKAFSMNFAMNSMKLNSFVLRQPRLQFESLADRNCASAVSPTTQQLKSALSPPLSNANKSNSASTNVALNSMSFGALNSATNSLLNSNSPTLATPANCSVCATAIPSKNLQQSRKYGAVACEACCKFVVKMRKLGQPLLCKGDGNNACNMYLSLKGYLKNFKKLYKERCSACWLRKCFQELQFPPEYKCRLSALLPATSNVTLTSAASMTSVKKTEGHLPEITLKLEKPAMELLSPTSGMSFGNSASVNSASETAISSQIKWKSKLEPNAPLANVDSVKIINPLKSNPLSENNATFGSTPLLLRPAILEKPLFLNKRDDKSDAIDTTKETPVAEDTTQQTKQTKSSRKSVKHEQKEKSTKDSETVLNVKTTTATLDSIDETSKNGESLSPTTAGAITEAQSPTTTMMATHITATSPSASTNILNNMTGVTTTATSSVSATTEMTTPSANGSDSVKRQRIDLKGPRVKHVCRSASIVLGQPLATFGEGDEHLASESEITNNGEVAIELKSPPVGQKPTSPPPQQQQQQKQMQPQETISNLTQNPKKPQILTDENDNCAGCKQESPASAALKSQVGTTVSHTKPLDGKKSPTQPPATTVPKSSTRNITSSTTLGNSSNGTKKYMRLSSEQSALACTGNGSAQQQSLASNKRSARELAKSKTLISIDFWENYDPAEVCQSGFGLIVTETVAQRALCFLCGATGLEPLMFCACCCEPYHQYCVLDEYNLKHYASFDDTMIANSSILDSSITTTTTALLLNSSNAINQISNRLNWLCPRCTVCYTCNMSSGSKVRCQKCQKNYHTTCLGTSKRLLGADRPLICVNCLKCKSCATTKVTKFVGNLPMCTQCFKLRKKGNYCPICQKCYDDNDFDLKMMECGECNRWVHAKCEGLSDEQYNLLSTLPESIEFICKKCARRNECAKQKAEEWRHAVMEEFRASLLSVLKLLSKSRQACALLKLSPRKKVRCTCGNGKMQPKALQFNGDEHSQLGSDGESQNSDDIYEFKDQPTQTPSIQSKPKSKCCACLLSYNSNCSSESFLSLVDIKQKISSNSYVSLAEFNYDMNNVIHQSNCDELIIAYKELLSEQFPWFQNETKACTDALEEDMFESCGGGYNAHSNSAMEDAPSDYSAIVTDNGQGGITDSVLEIPVDIDDIVCYALKSRVDTRVCLFCRKTGEGLANEEARLLYCGHDCWVHTNCAMWSAEVFEEIDGSLQNVHSAVSRGRMIKCTVCGNRGATVGCNVKSCGEHYHYPCARSIPECAFLTDKSMYCPAHAKNASFGTNVSHETNFEVSRPVYVELDRKRKKLIEPSKVQFHIGSLEVKQLGAVVPRFSDSFEALVPINFLCSRLYWSLKEPWKIVEYTVRTTIQNSYSTLTTMDTGRNFTVDHTNANSSLVQLGLAQIALWHNSLARGDLIDMESSGNAASEMATLSKFFPDYISQNSCSAVPDENTEEEPQNNGDLLPPEIKDAIFEDLPHELLDGISMLDIFMYEDLGDAKTEMFALGEQSKDGINTATANNQANASTSNTATSNMHISDEDTANSSGFGKQLELSNSWPTGNLTVNHVEDAMLSAARTNQSKYRGANKTSTTGATGDLLIKKPNQGAQTRTWPKLDSNSMAVIKRRKLSKGLAEGMLLSLNHQQQRSKASKETAAIAGISRRQSICTGELAESGAIRSKTFTWSAAKRYIDASKDDLKDEQMTSKIKIMQMDGVDDSITTEFRIITSDAMQSSGGTGQFNGQVRCERCQCTYRNFESFQRHLANCEPMSTSESESETTNGLSNDQHQHHITTATLTAETLNELQKQAAAAATSGLPFLQATFPQVQNLSTIGSLQSQLNGIPLTNLQGLQGVQGLQGLQNLQLQQLQPQPLGGGFFISQANPTQTATTANDELQLYANSLQSLANLNGGFTLTQPTVTSTQTTSQPQFIALSTNPDGTQQFIQLPQNNGNATAQLLHVTANNNAATAAAYQTLQATNSNKKIVLPVTGKPLKTVATKAAQQATAAAKQRQLKAAHSVKPIQAKLVAPATSVNIAQQQQQQPTPITLLNPTTANSNAATQLLSQQLLQPQLLFQTANPSAGTGAPSLIMQQPQTQNIISFVTSDGTQNPPQLQYVTIPTTSDFKTPQPAPTFLTTTAGAPTSNANSLLQGAATFLQTDASGNLMLTTAQTPSGLQMLATPLQAAQPQLIGTLIQPQTLQLGGNVQLTTGGADSSQAGGAGGQSQQPLIIGGGATTTTTATGLEFAAAAAPQVILATQPMYYGLETIVQNTVMSSQQFVSTAMPGVLSQNASFSATTTQVFQASKIEPIVDIPASYVVLNNATVDAGAGTNAAFLNAANAAVLQPQATASLDDATQQLFRLQTAATDQTTTSSSNYQFQQQQQQNESILVTAKVPPQVAQTKRLATQMKSTPIAVTNKVQPQPQQVVNKVLPTSIAQQHTKLIGMGGKQTSAQYQRQLADGKTKPTLTASGAPPSIASKPLQNRKTNLIRPMHKVEVKPKIMKPTPNNVKAVTVQQQQQQQTPMLANKQLGATTASLGISYNGATLLPTQPKMQPPIAVQQQQQTQQQQLQFPVIAATIAPTQPTTASNPFILTTNNIINVLEPVQQQQQQQQHQQQQQQQQPQQITYQNNNNNLCFSSNELVIPTTTSDSNVCNISNRLLQQYQTANNLPTNIVNPLQQQQQQHTLTVTTTATMATSSQAMTINTRPTNRVLPMQQRQESPPHTTTVVSSTQATAQATLATKSVATIQQQFAATTTAEIPNKCYAQIEPKATLYEAEVKPLYVSDNGNLNNTPIITVAAAPILQQQQQQQQHEANVNIYEKQICQAKNPGDFMLLESCEQQIDMSHCLLNKDNFELNSNHIGHMETDADCMGNNELIKHEMNGITRGNSNDDDAIVDDGDEEEDDEEDDDDDFSLKMPTPDGEDHEMSDGEEPAVKEKISKILDNLTNDDCADSIATATTVEATAVAVAAELQNDAGYQQMVEDVLAKTATANAGATDECDALDATDMANFTATAEETAAVAAAATAYITEMAKAHELQQFKQQLEVDLAKPPTLVDNSGADNEANLITNAAVTATMATATIAPPQQPPSAREIKKISGPHLLYEIQSEDGFTYKSTSITEIWEKVFEAVQVARRAHGLAPLPEGPLADMSGVQMIGLKTNALKYLIEQLPGVEKCTKYTPKYHKRDLQNANAVTTNGNGTINGCNGSSAIANSNAMSANNVCVSDLIGTLLDYSSDQDELQENPYECARVEPYSSRSEYDMFSWLASRHRKQPIQVFVQPSDTEMVPRRGTGSNLPMAMKYRTLKETYKDYVGVFRSHIHGRGLYCTKDIEAGEMVIEYAGELIRSTLTDKRERYYDSRGIGCYMFKIDDNLVVDATMRGNAARFINHSCEPNCYSKVVDILGHKHIIIFALRRIVQGEELTYDYKFPFEDEKIPCSCGSKKCRKYLN